MMDYRIETGSNDFDVEEVVELVSKIYGPNYFSAKQIHGWLIRHEPSFSPQNFVMAKAENGTLIGLVRIVNREMRFGPSILTCGGISTVGVHDHWRKKGIASALVIEAEKAMQGRGIDMAFLHARRVLDGFYTRVGYWGVNRYLNLEIGSPPRNASELESLPLQKENLSELEISYASEYGKLAGSIVRNGDMWSFLIGRAAVLDQSFVVRECRVRDTGKFAGYLVLSGDTLHEAVIEADYFSSVPGLFAELQLKYLALHPFHPLFIYLRSKYSTTLTERFAIDGGYMGKIINMESFLGKYAAYVHQKSGASPRELRLCGYALDLEKGTAKRTNNDDDIQFCDQRTCLWFLLGILEPTQIAGITMRPGISSIDTLNLGTGFHTSSWDGF